MKRNLLCVALALVLLCVFSAGTRAAEKEIRIGFMTDLTKK